MSKTLQSKLAFLLLAILLSRESSCWKSGGHSVISYIAQTLLEKTDQTILQKVFDMLEPLQIFFPETKGSLMEAAAMPNVMSHKFFGFLDHYQFIEKPILYWKDKEKAVNLPRPPFAYNLTYGVTQAQNIIKQALDSDYHKDAQIKVGLMDSLMLRYLLNAAGNAHLPVNNASFYSSSLFESKMVNGDLSGMRIWVNDVFGAKIETLHDLFSTGFNSFDMGLIDMPYSEIRASNFKQQGDYLMGKYPEEYFGNMVENINVDDWCEESYTIANDFVYSQVEMFPVLGPEYIITGRRLCEERIVLAGYRLARLLVSLFTQKKVEPFVRKGNGRDFYVMFYY